MSRRTLQSSAMQSDLEGGNKMAAIQMIIYICTSAQLFNVDGFMRAIRNIFPNISVEVKYLPLPYNDLDKFVLPEDVDSIILCHSIHNRRFAITNVLDAIYDKFLPHAKEQLGKERVGVIVHDFPIGKVDTEEKYKVEMDAFRHKQPTAFDCSSLTMIAGKLSVQPPELQQRNWFEIENFLRGAASYRAKMSTAVQTKWICLGVWLAMILVLMLKWHARKLTIAVIWVLPTAAMGLLILKAMHKDRVGAWKIRIWSSSNWKLCLLVTAGLHALYLMYSVFFVTTIIIYVCSPKGEISMESFTKTLSTEYRGLGVFKTCTLQSKEDFPGRYNNHDITILAHSYKYGGYDLPQVENDILENKDNVYRVKERTVVMVYDISYERLDTSEEYRQEMREFQKAEPNVAKNSALTLLTVEVHKIFKYQRDIIDEIKDVV